MKQLQLDFNRSLFFYRSQKRPVLKDLQNLLDECCCQAKLVCSMTQSVLFFPVEYLRKYYNSGGRKKIRHIGELRDNESSSSKKKMLVKIWKNKNAIVVQNTKKLRCFTLVKDNDVTEHVFQIVVLHLNYVRSKKPQHKKKCRCKTCYAIYLVT